MKQTKTNAMRMLDRSAENRDTIVVSAGHVGMLMELDPGALMGMVSARTEEITK